MTEKVLIDYTWMDLKRLEEVLYSEDSLEGRAALYHCEILSWLCRRGWDDCINAEVLVEFEEDTLREPTYINDAKFYKGYIGESGAFGRFCIVGCMFENDNAFYPIYLDWEYKLFVDRKGTKRVHKKYL